MLVAIGGGRRVRPVRSEAIVVSMAQELAAGKPRIATISYRTLIIAVLLPLAVRRPKRAA